MQRIKATKETLNIFRTFKPILQWNIQSWASKAIIPRMFSKLPQLNKKSISLEMQTLFVLAKDHLTFSQSSTLQHLSYLSREPKLRTRDSLLKDNRRDRASKSDSWEIDFLLTEATQISNRTLRQPSSTAQVMDPQTSLEGVKRTLLPFQSAKRGKLTRRLRNSCKRKCAKLSFIRVLLTTSNLKSLLWMANHQLSFPQMKWLPKILISRIKPERREMKPISQVRSLVSTLILNLKREEREQMLKDLLSVLLNSRLQQTKVKLIQTCLRKSQIMIRNLLEQFRKFWHKILQKLVSIKRSHSISILSLKISTMQEFSFLSC